MLFGDGRVEALRDGIHNVDVFNRHHNGFAQVVVAFYVRRDTDLVNYVGDYDLKVGAG